MDYFVFQIDVYGKVGQTARNVIFYFRILYQKTFPFRMMMFMIDIVIDGQLLYLVFV